MKSGAAESKGWGFGEMNEGTAFGGTGRYVLPKFSVLKNNNIFNIFKNQLVQKTYSGQK